MDREAVLAAFDEQMRMSARAPGSGARIERAGSVVRYVATRADGWSAVLGSRLDEASADAAIAEQIRYFAEMGRTFEWKHYAHDLPLDLPRRLIAAGFAAGAEEALMVAESAGLDTAIAPPPGVRIVAVSDEVGVALLQRVHEEVFGGDHSGLCSALLAQLAKAPDTVAAVVAMAGDVAVSAARAELHRGTEFASLWGGCTLPSFQGRGIYRALVAHRARIALERGFRYVQVDALPTSRPILERLGFVEISKTTPYIRRAA
jgi:ribosomal protein S18 acetylase RimI-like enzyme